MNLVFQIELFISSSLPKFVKPTLAYSPIPSKSFKAQDSKTNSLKNPNVKEKPLKANIPKAQRLKLRTPTTSCIHVSQ